MHGTGVQSAAAARRDLRQGSSYPDNSIAGQIVQSGLGLSRMQHPHIHNPASEGMPLKITHDLISIVHGHTVLPESGLLFKFDMRNKITSLPVFSTM